MSNFIFEDKIELIKNKHTKEYLNEVLSTYHNKEYRSCIIVLYATVFTDLLEKFKLLSEYYNDESCESFLTQYKEKRKDKTKYSELERDVIEFAIDNGFLNDVEKKQLNHLKDYRDFCAHPVVCENLQLISPTQEQVRAQIRNMFETVFLKDAIINNRIIKNFIPSIQEYFDRNGIENFETYVKSKYLNHLDKKTQKKLLKDLWKFVFYYTDDYECNKYREIAFNALTILYQTNKSELNKYMLEEQAFFNGKIKFEKVDIKKDDNFKEVFSYSSTSIIILLHKNPELFDIINTANKQELKSIVLKNINFMVSARYLYNSSDEHIAKLKEYMISNDLNCCINSRLMLKINKFALENFDYAYQDFIIYYFINRQNSIWYQPDYDYINCTYKELLSKIIDSLTEEQFDKLLTGLDYNNVAAHTFNEMVQQIYNTIQQKNYNIVYSNYNINIEKYVEK